MDNRHTGSGGVAKWALIVLLVFVVLCHGIRLTAGGVVSPGYGSLSSLSKSGASGSVINSLNSFRKRCGHSIESLAGICPEAIEPHCRTATRGISVVLGTN